MFFNRNSPTLYLRKAPDTGKTNVIHVLLRYIKKRSHLVDLEEHYDQFDEDYTEFEETYDFLKNHDYLAGQSFNELSHPMLPLLVIARQKLIWKKKLVSSHNTFRQALENVNKRAACKTAMYKNLCEIEEERMMRNEETVIKQAGELEQKRKNRLYESAVPAALRRSLEVEEQICERRLRNALRTAYRRSTETPEQRAERRRKDLLRSARRRQHESELHSKIRKYNDAVRAALRRRNETPEQRAQRKMIDIFRAARRRSMETSEQREARLKADRERAAKRRLFKKLQIFDQGVSEQQQIKHFNLKIMKTEPDLAFTDVDRNETVLKDVDIIFSKKVKNLAEQRNVIKVTDAKNTDVKEIKGKDRSKHSALNGYKKSKIIWCS